MPTAEQATNAHAMALHAQDAALAAWTADMEQLLEDIEEPEHSIAMRAHQAEAAEDERAARVFGLA